MKGGGLQGGGETSTEAAWRCRDTGAFQVGAERAAGEGVGCSECRGRTRAPQHEWVGMLGEELADLRSCWGWSPLEARQENLGTEVERRSDKGMHSPEGVRGEWGSE